MKVKESKSLFHGSVCDEDEVVIETSEEESDELRKALRVVDKYRLASLNKIKYHYADQDWTMVEYDVKNDKVTVKIIRGACG